VCIKVVSLGYYFLVHYMELSCYQWARRDVLTGVSHIEQGKGNRVFLEYWVSHLKSIPSSASCVGTVAESIRDAIM
jgi:hypothetical protein